MWGGYALPLKKGFSIITRRLKINNGLKDRGTRVTAKSLYYVSGHTLWEIERILGIPTSTLNDYFTGKTYNGAGRKYMHEKKIPKESTGDDWETGNNLSETGLFNLKAAKALPIERRVLVMPDLHIPAEHEDAIAHCLAIKNKYNCNVIINVGDIVDNHASSYHESDSNLPSAGWELGIVIERLKIWHDAFENMIIVESNHGNLPARKLNTAGVPKEWLRSQEKVYKTPTWKFVGEHILDDVLYTHGMGMKNDLRSCKAGLNTVSGHTHSEANITYNFGYNRMLWSMKVGAMVDRSHPGMRYAYHGKPPALGCGVVLENGTLPIFEPYRF